MDLAHIRGHGVGSLLVYCTSLVCNHRLVMNVDDLPGDTMIASLEPRMVCTRCGRVGADIRPNWSERGVEPVGAARMPAMTTALRGRDSGTATRGQAARAISAAPTLRATIGFDSRARAVYLIGHVLLPIPRSSAVRRLEEEDWKE